MASYPAREPFFSQKYIRLLAKCCAAQDIGADGCWLLTVIVGLEDAKRYSAPVTFLNEQLYPLLGGGIKPLTKARKKAIDFGWLNYVQGAKGRSGKYWVMVPDQYREIDDSPCDGIALPIPNGTGNGTDNGQATGRSYPKRDRQRAGNGTYNGSTLLPGPSPSPNTPSTDVDGIRPRAKKKKNQPREYSPEFLAWWDHYPRKVSKPSAQTAFTAALSRISTERAVSADQALAWLIDRTETYARHVADHAARHIKHPGPWLNDDRYIDEHDAPAKSDDCIRADVIRREYTRRMQRDRRPEPEIHQAIAGKLRAEGLDRYMLPREIEVTETAPPPKPNGAP